MGVCGAPIYIAAQTTSATNIGLIFAASPALILLLSRLLGIEQRLSGRRILGMLACLFGVLVIITRSDPLALAHLGLTTGDLWAVFGASGWALYSVLLKRWRSLLPFAVRFGAIVLAGVLVLLPFYWFESVHGQAMSLDARSIETVVLLALVPGLAAYSAHAHLTTVLGAGRTALLLYLLPVYNAALACTLLGEPLRLFHLVGGLSVLFGVYLATTAGRHGHK
jgi:drug/metabolite transporter (DMT)-like permease